MTRLVLICGLPSAGKTTLARRLGPALGAVQLRPDERMSDLGLDGHDEAARERVERLQWTLAQDLLRLGFSVVLESGFWAKAERDSCRKRAREIGIEVELRYLAVNVDDLWARIITRNGALPDATYEFTREQLESWVPYFQAPERSELALFDPPTRNVRRAERAALTRPPGGRLP
jgi:predicted kinase